jgi:hypothetical protein
MAMVDIAEQPDKRIAVSRERLESEITEAVRRLEAGCKGFVGVIIERLEPKSHADPNWAIKGVRFGRADREKAAKVLPTVVERMQREFTLAKTIPQTPKQSANNTNPPPTVVERIQLGSAENEAATPQTPKQSGNDTNPSRVSRKRRRVRSGKALKATDETPQTPKVDQNSAEVFPNTAEAARSTPAGYVDSPGLAEEG